jgi:hypothetical protein
MDRRMLILCGVSLLIIIAAVALFVIPAPVSDTGSTGSPQAGTSTTVVSHDDLIRVTSPTSGEAISSPVIVTGQARGSWYFEAQFPIEVLDSTGKVIGQGPATAQGDWETSQYVPFTDTIILTTTPASGSAGTIVLKKDNPSGAAASDDSLSVPVVFQ